MWTALSAAEATGGKAHGDWQAECVSIDSRALAPGQLFVAIKGERFDGHDYVKDALAHGAGAALVSHVPDDVSRDAPLLLVKDTTKALIDLAVYCRAQTQAKLIGVTGSVGKTGTKEALRLALATGGKVHANAGNLNNHIGLPLSLASLPDDARFAVLEMGMNHTGELSMLTRIARPHIAIITTVEAVHLEFFSSVEQIADAKAEIMEGMPADGTIILNRDNRFFAKLRAHAERHGIKNIVAFGMHEEAAFRLLDYRIAGLGSEVTALCAGEKIIYRLGTIGKHWAVATLAVLAAAKAAGCNLKQAAEALEWFSEPEGRGKLYTLTLPQGTGQFTLIDDCYNASPASVAAAIAKLDELHAGLDTKGKKIAVLGDMLELGMSASDFHASLAEPLTRYNIDAVYACGPMMKHLYDALPESLRAGYAADSATLTPLVAGAVAAGDTVMIKGSNGSRMKLVREALMQADINKEEFADAL